MSSLKMGVCAALVVFGASAPTVLGQLEGRIVRVGLFAGGRPILRNGAWSFVEVELLWRGERALDGELRVEQVDRDGDVATSVLATPLTPDGQWHRYEVYFPPHDVARSDDVRVRFYDEADKLVMMLGETGEPVRELVSKPFYDLPADWFLIVDLTVPRRLRHVAWLDSDKVGKADWTDARRVRPLSPPALPSRWEGLQAVDAIVWDNADPTGLSPQQISALIDWVRAGGRLLITAGSNWQALANSALAEALPVTLTGVEQVREAQEFIDIVTQDTDKTRLDRHYSENAVTRCRMSPRPDALGIPAECDNAQIAYRRLLGRGSLTFVGASLTELLPVPEPFTAPSDGAPVLGSDALARSFDVRLWEDVVGRQFLALSEVREEEGGGILSRRENLFHRVRDSIGFQETSAVFLIFAILFAIAYTLAATFGSWWYLKRRSWEHQCWGAFALVAIAGSVVGTGMVWTLRGVRTKVWQTTVVDGQSGTDYGYATCLFGVKTPRHMRLDLRLPVGVEDEAVVRRCGPLRAMPEETSIDEMASRFVAPERYEIDVAYSRLVDVPVRATLKEFQGAWHGPLGGTLDARLVARQIDVPSVPLRYVFAEGSHIRNNLGVDLRDCFILETPDEVALRGFGVGCYRLGDLPKSGPGSTLDGRQIEQRLFYERKPRSDPADPPTLLVRRPPLSDQIKQWRRELPGRYVAGGGPLGGRSLTADQEVTSLYLLSVFDLLEAEPQGGRVLHRANGRTLDCTHQLTRTTAILIGWSDDPPPAVLEIDRARYTPDKSRTIYRFVIPVER